MIHFVNNNVNNKNKRPIKSWCKDVEDSAMEQASNLANLPFLHKWVALMPDCHSGYGMPIGGVIALDNAVIPNAVGVDIGCGMGAIKTSIKASDVEKWQLETIMQNVKKNIPVGMNHHSHSTGRFTENYKHFETLLHQTDGFTIQRYKEIFNIKNERTWFEDLIKYFSQNLGTLGGGNHFIEIQKDENDNIWLMIHSGSRNIGYKIANHYHQKALELNKKWYSNIPHEDLAFLPANSIDGQEYIDDMNFALDFAEKNRFLIMEALKTAFLVVFDNAVEWFDEINIHHNFASLENHYGKNVWVHRKGATSAKKDQLGIIPGSMGTSSYIVKGLGNPESFMSCSHGAGRKMGRKEASKTLSKEDCEKSMDGIVYDGFQMIKDRKGNESLDLGEAPLAYKDIDNVIESELDLIEPIVKLKPLAVIKG